MNVGERIRKIRKNKGWTLEELKDRTGMSVSFLSDIERSVSNPSLKRLKLIAKALDVTVSYLLDEVDSTIKATTTSVPEVYSIKSSKNIISEDNIKNYHWVEKNQVENGTYFFIEANDNSMANSGIMTGSKVLIKKQDSIQNSEIAAVLSSTEEKCFMFRKILKTDGQWVLQPDNTNFESIILPKEKLVIIGKVVRVIHDFE